MNIEVENILKNVYYVLVFIPLIVNIVQLIIKIVHAFSKKKDKKELANYIESLLNDFSALTKQDITLLNGLVVDFSKQKGLNVKKSLKRLERSILTHESKKN